MKIAGEIEGNILNTLSCFHCTARYTYPGKLKSAIQAAEKEGWMVLHDETCFCPNCLEEMKNVG